MEKHCYYSGQVIGQAHSTAAISTCDGIRSVFQIFPIGPLGEPALVAGFLRVFVLIFFLKNLRFYRFNDFISLVIYI